MMNPIKGPTSIAIDFLNAELTSTRDEWRYQESAAPHRWFIVSRPVLHALCVALTRTDGQRAHCEWLAEYGPGVPARAPR